MDLKELLERNGIAGGMQDVQPIIASNENCIEKNSNARPLTHVAIEWQ